ncbi:GAF and ANTAR domain-containing protein [Knoellia sp. S7-12]|uniref:GAF and ANTAR domain-containing protein n=1 Tax=Knoellia sp. S7-12 TaxID=3126698 RepID=UPI0033687CD6
MTDIDTGTAVGSHPQEVLLQEVGGVLSSVDEMHDYVVRVVHSVRNHVTGCDEVGITLLVDGRPSTVAYTTVTTLEIDAVQYQLDEGPCLEAARTQTEVLASLGGELGEGSADARWPHFAEAVRRDGMRSLLALPLVSGDVCVGALNLYGHAPDAFAAFEASLVRTAASRVADAIVAVLQLDGAQRLAGQLEQAMASRAVIEQAKGAIMAMRGVDEHASFEWLRETSQTRNIKVRTLAEQVLAGLVAAEVPADDVTA